MGGCNFREPPPCEVRRITLPRTSVNSGRRQAEASCLSLPELTGVGVQMVYDGSATLSVPIGEHRHKRCYAPAFAVTFATDSKGGGPRISMQAGLRSAAALRRSQSGGLYASVSAVDRSLASL